MENLLTYPEKTDVCLVCMPAANLRMPAMSLSLLKSCLTTAGIKSFVDYENMHFAKKIGLAAYDRATMSKITNMATEYIFAESAHENLKYSTSDYVDWIIKHVPAYLDKKKFDRDEIYGFLMTLKKQSSEFLDEAAKRILSMQPKIVAFSSMFQQNNATIGVARRLKAKAPNIVIMVGGANCMGDAGKALLKYVKEFDYVFFGEADEIFADICAAVIANKKIPTAELPFGVLGRDFDENNNEHIHRLTKNLDALPYPDFKEFFDTFAKIFPKREPGFPVAMVEGSRGCWWGAKNPCTFCGLNGMARSYRAKSTKRLVEELEYLATAYPQARTCIFTDSIQSHVQTKELPKFMTPTASRFEYFTEIKANISEDDIKALKSVGFVQFQPGIESIQDDILAIMHKGCRAIKQIELLQNCRKHGVKIIWNLLCGFPGEKEEYLAEIAELIPKLTYLEAPSNLINIIYQKYSVYTENPARYGLELRPAEIYEYIYEDNRDFIERTAYNFEPVDEEECFLYYNHSKRGKAYADVLQLTDTWRKTFTEDLPDRMDVTIKGSKVEIFDLRKAAEKMFYQLDGLRAEIYRDCFKVQKLKDLLTKFANQSESDLREVLDWLCAQNLMLNIKDEYLSLGIVRNA